MNQTVRTFRAASAEEAMAQIRREMGLDAQVVEVKDVSRRGLLSWFSSRQVVEVTATRPAVTQRKSIASTTVSARATVPTTAGTIAASAVKTPVPREALPTIPSATASLVVPEVAPVVLPPPRRIVDTSIPDPLTKAAPHSIEQRLDALQQMITDLARRPQARGLVEIPPELFPHYLNLIESDVDDLIARELIQKLHHHAAPDQLADTSTTMAMLTAMIEQQIPCGNSLVPVTGRRQIAMVVGPTGVGKTTTLAKLAGRLGVQGGSKVGLITIDTYRVAAVEQLRTYAEIIDRPMRIVTNPAEMRDALDDFIDCDLVLIDTAGRSPHDDRKLEELKQMIDAAQPDHVYLVLSLACGASSLRSSADRFASVRPTSVVFTKLDEATGCGGLLSAARDIGLTASYFTTGQEVPGDIEPANPCRAARLILGTETIHDRLA